MLFPSKLINDTAASTYNNVKEAEKAFYSNCLIPIVNLFYEALSNGFGLTANGEALRPDYSGIESLMADKKIEAETTKISDDIWKGRYESNLITLNEYLTALGLPLIANGNLYARDNKDIPLAVRIGVGGTQSLQLILSDQNLSSEQKINIVIIVFGLSPEEAKLLAGGEPIKPEPINTGIEQTEGEQANEPTE
jgi:hypothetical protein